MPMRIEAGTATKNTCNCGISRDSTPRPRLNRMPKAMKGAEIWTARVKPRPIALMPASPPRPMAGTAFGRQHVVAAADRVDGEVMQVGREDQGDAEQRQEVAERRLLAAHGRIDRHGVGQAELLRDDRARRSAGRPAPSGR